jgi:DNA-binding beta-propeller fold protein YncE
VYVLNSGTNSACQSTGSISTITASTLSVSNTICIGKNPSTMAQSPINGFIYAINQGDNPASVSVFNPTSNTVTPITMQDGLGANPVSIAINSTGWIFVVTQGDGVNPGTLDVIKPGTATIVGTAPLGVLPTFSVVDTNRDRLYVTNSGDNTVSVFDASSVNQGSNSAVATLATVPVGTQPIGVAVLPDGTNFYVANAGSDNVTVVSQHSFSPQTTVALPAGANPVFITADPTSQKVYVADPGTSQTTIIQTSNNTVAQNIAAPAQNPSCTSSCALQSPVMIVTK